MALIAHPPTQFPARHDRAWDEAIVPALRQRLESESRVLTKRMSSASIPSGNEGELAPPPSRLPYGARSTTDPPPSSSTGRITPVSQKPSAIPRPSISQDPGRTPSKTNSRPVGKAPSVKRSRTQSTPYPYGRSSSSLSTNETAQVPTGIPTPASSRAASPMISKLPELRPSRIPTVATRVRSGSSSTHDYGQPKTNGVGTRSKERLELGQQPQIRDEPAPFPPGQRASADSLAERPFEHWYRGEAARNGGVGEYRVGKMEMLDIANFGHQRPIASSTPRRMRADSMEGKRESWFLDDREREAVIRGMGRVMDEDPLTDLDGDTDMDATSSPGHNRVSLPPPVPPPVPPLPAAEQQQQQQLPMPTSPPPQATTRTSGAVPSTPRPQVARARGSAPGQAQPSSSRVQTPGAPQKPPRARTKSRGPVPKQRSKSAHNIDAMSSSRDSTLADAIPSMGTLPPRGGNWDEIVLPSVARRMGIEGYGVKGEDGIVSVPGYIPPRRSEEKPIEPAPGTFGYDFRPARDPGDTSEFGERDAPISEKEDTPPPTLASRKRSMPRMADRPPSPAPFSSYTPNVTTPEPRPSTTSIPVTKRNKRETMPEIKVSPPSVRDEPLTKEDLDEGAGCCKCVIM